jgi:hypothetical protein
LISRAIAFDDIPGDLIQRLVGCFGNVLRSGNGTLGFTKGILPDADDTSRVILALAVLQSPPDVQPLLKHFFADTHFRSYALEGSPSFTVNCNVLLTLLECPTAYPHLEVIEQTLRFLLTAWDNGGIVDKWHLDSGYYLMLFSDCLLKLLQRLEDGAVTLTKSTFAKEGLVMVICQILARVLGGQLPDGSWDHSLECTSYSVITITQCLQLPWSADLRARILAAAKAGQNAISKSEGDAGERNEYLWVEKVSYGSALLRKSYMVSALHATHHEAPWSPDTKKLFSAFNATTTKGMVKLLTKTPLFQAHPVSFFDLVLLESAHYSGRLRAQRNLVFAEADVLEANDKYVDFIPVFWVACNSIRAHPLSPNTIWQMCLLSQLVYQVDAYMEVTFLKLPTHVIEVIQARLAIICQQSKPSRKRKRPMEGNRVPENSLLNGDASSAESISDVLDTYTKWVLKHPSVLQSPPAIQRQLASELHDFFLAHISHMRDNRNLRTTRECPDGANDDISSSLDGTTYVDWVTTTGADDTSCPFASLFFSCLISAPGPNCFSVSAQVSYLFQSMTRHLAIMCRQYNDYGSVARDFAENNLNSLDFAEFGGLRANCDGSTSDPGREAKNELMDIAEFERSYMDIAIQRLVKVLGEGNQVMTQMQVFVDVTDLWGQVYVLKDLTGRLVQ